jgi:hypothetical protein
LAFEPEKWEWGDDGESGDQAEGHWLEATATKMLVLGLWGAHAEAVTGERLREFLQGFSRAAV